MRREPVDYLSPEPSKHAGPSLRELVFRKLDEVMDWLMETEQEGGDELDQKVGEARGLATALAIFTNPYNPSVDAIRAEAMDRWEARNAE